MARLGNNGSGKTDWYGSFGSILSAAFEGEVFEGLNVEAQGSPNMTVKVNPGVALVRTGTDPNEEAYLVRLDTSGGVNVTITTADGSNPRIDVIVGYYDESVIDTDNPNNPDSLTFIAVAGTPNAVPTAPSGGTIDTAVSSNPYFILAEVLVGTGVSSITNTDITDVRSMASAVLAPGAVDYDKTSTPTAFAAKRGSAQSVATSEFVKIEFDSEEYDDGDNYDNSTNYRFTVPADGLYHFDAQVQNNDTSDGTITFILLYKNGSELRRGTRSAEGASGVTQAVISADLKLEATDYIEVYMFTDSSTSAADEAYFNGHRIR